MKKPKNYLFSALIALFMWVSCRSAETLSKSEEKTLLLSIGECQMISFVCTIRASQKGTNPTAKPENLARLGLLDDRDYAEVWCIVVFKPDNNTFYQALYYRNKPSLLAWSQSEDDRLIYPVLNADFAKVGCTQLPQFPETITVTVNLSPLPTPRAAITKPEAIKLAKTYLDGEATKAGVIVLGAESMTYVESHIRLGRIIPSDLGKQAAETKVWVVGFKNAKGFFGALDRKSVYTILRASDGGHITNYFPLDSDQIQAFSNQ